MASASITIDGATFNGDVGTIEAMLSLVLQIKEAEGNQTLVVSGQSQSGARSKRVVGVDAATRVSASFEYFDHETSDAAVMRISELPDNVASLLLAYKKDQ
jgi:hypothetical protein